MTGQDKGTMEMTTRGRPSDVGMPMNVRAALLATAAFALALQAVAATTSLGSALSPNEHATLMAISMGAAVIAALLAAARAPQHRPALLIVAAAISLYALGDAYFFLVQKTLTTFPTVSDFLWLSLYPLLAAGLVLIIRSETPGQRLEVWLEGGIVALTATAAGYALLEPILSSAAGTPTAAGQLAYPLLDLGTLTVLAISGLGTRGGLRPGYLLIGLGMVVLLVTDLVSLHQSAATTYVPGTLLDCGWSAAVLLIALALQLQGPILKPRVLEGRAFYLVVLLAVSTSVALSVIVGVTDRDAVVLALTALVPVLVVSRLLLSIDANQRLSDDNAAIIATAGAGILSVDRDGQIVSVNPAAAKMLGWGQAELMGRDSHATFHHKRINGASYPRSKCPVTRAIESGRIQRVTGEVFWRKDHTSFPVDYTCSPTRNEGVIVGAVVVFDDVSRQHRLRASLRYQAEHDPLTGLHNRRYLADHANEQIRRAKRERRPGALAIIDLDATKFVNDSFGHSAGDELLRKVASVLTRGVRETDVVARLGGDEFAVLVCEAEAPAATAVIEGLLEQIKRESSPTITASAGICPFDGGKKLTGDDLLICADLALYEAKRNGGDRAVRFSGRRGSNLTWFERIREAIKEDRFIAYTQPIVNLKSGRVVREEMLIRMRNESGDIVPPAAFLPTAERFGLIGDIDRLMVEKGLGLAGQGRAVAVNVSARSLSDPEITQSVGDAISAGLDPRLISFEITETSAATNMQAATDFATRLERLGCELALDDFGTGFGSFTYLRHLPVQVIKIDIDFVRDLPHSISDFHLVRVLVSLAGSLGQKTVAEGVEDAGAVDILRRLGVDFAQGHLLGEPRPVVESRPREPDPAARAALTAPLHS
jgi:diguanylate cyclase (GGDEF)-like protein/PAS domain S-box-containing protein